MRWAQTLLGEQRNAEDPTQPLTAGDFNAWLETGVAAGSGVPVSERTAMGLTAYLRAVSLIASSMAGLPIRVYYRDSRRRVTQKTVLDSPSTTQTPFEHWQTWYMHQLSWGNAYGFKRRDGAGTVRTIDIIHPSRVTVAVNAGQKLFTVTGDDGKTTTYDSFAIAHLPFLAPDGQQGLSPLQACRTTLGAAIAAETVTESFFRNGTKLSGIVNTTAALTSDQAQTIKQRWRSVFAGPSRAGDVAVLDSGATFTPLSLPPEDAQLLQSRAFSVAEIARIFGIPSHFLNEEKASSWGTGIEQMGIGYVTYTLLPRVRATEQRITRELLPGGWESGQWEARIDLKGLLQGDSATRAAFYRQLMDMKTLTNHDIAALEDMDAPAGPPVYVMPSNMAMVQADDQATVEPLTGASSAQP